MKKTGGLLRTMLLVHLALLAATLAFVANMPLSFPEYLQPDGAKPPMDAAVVHAAALRLLQAGGAVFWACILTDQFKATGKLVTLYTCGAVAYAAFRAVEVVCIIAIWMNHLQGPMAAKYRLAVAAPCAFIVLFAGLNVYIHI